MPFHERVARTKSPSPAVRTSGRPTPGSGAAGPIAGLPAGLGNRGLRSWIVQRSAAKPVQRAEMPEEEELQMKRDPSKPLQRAEMPEEEELQMKRDPSRPVQRAEMPEEEELQMKRDPAASGGSGPAAQRKPNGIPDGVLQKMEASFGTSFADVNVHVGGEAPSVGALAFTRGNDIHFAPGQYNPETRSGQELLGHELAHVVQQREGRVQANGEVNGVPLNDDPSLEAEADRLGAKAASGG